MTFPELALVTALWAVWVFALVVLLRGVSELNGGRPAAVRARADVQARGDYTALPLRPIGSTRP